MDFFIYYYLNTQALKLVDHIQQDFSDSHSEAKAGTGLITDADRENRDST